MLFALEILMVEGINKLVSEYMYLSREVLPTITQIGRRNWSVSEDHCFQRIILDHVCGGVWYEYLERPAYKNLTKDQAQRVVKICEDIGDGNLDLQKLDQQSLIWADKHRQA